MFEYRWVSADDDELTRMGEAGWKVIPGTLVLRPPGRLGAPPTEASQVLMERSTERSDTELHTR